MTQIDPLPSELTSDVVVVGGGPAGTTTATLLADAGHRVVLLEREHFPRFKIGESLIPGSYEVLQRLGMLDKLAESSFPKKHSVQFFTSDGRAGKPFYFKEIDPSERSQTWQVLRSDFDQMMLDNAREHGVEAHEGAQVKEVLFEDDRAVGVRAVVTPADSEDGGQEITIRSQVVVDATGQRAMLARKLGLKQSDPCLRMAAIFTHFEGGLRDEGIDEGATLILHNETQDAWFWYIPLPDDRVSVGVVGSIPYLIQGRQGDPQKIFDEEIGRCLGIQPRLKDARQVSDIQVLNDFSYVTKQVAGDGWVLVGDACGFLDPMYSSGVLLALRSGELAADAIHGALEAGDPSGERLGTFGDDFRSGLGAFKKLVYAFYTKGFSFGRFLKQHPDHRLPIILILQGDVFDYDFEPFFRDLDTMLGNGHGVAPEQGTTAVAATA